MAVNPWGTFKDIENGEKKYTSFLMSALSEEARPYAVGYLLDELVMNIARENGCTVYGHGADMNFWGTDLLPGLLSRKSAAGMQPVPEGKIQAFLITDQPRSLALHQHCLFMELIDPEIVKTYFQKREEGWSGSTQELIKPIWEHASELAHTSEQWLLHHFGNTPLDIQIPEGMHIIEHT